MIGLFRSLLFYSMEAERPRDLDFHFGEQRFLIPDTDKNPDQGDGRSNPTPRSAGKQYTVIDRR